VGPGSYSLTGNLEAKSQCDFRHENSRSSVTLFNLESKRVMALNRKKKETGTILSAHPSTTLERGRGGNKTKKKDASTSWETPAPVNRKSPKCSGGRDASNSLKERKKPARELWLQRNPCLRKEGLCHAMVKRSTQPELV